MVELYRRVGGEFLADGTPQGAHFLGGTVRLGSGGFVVSVVDRATSAARFQIYDDAGAPVGGEQPIGNGRLVELASGFAVARQAGSEVRVQHYSDTGAAVGSEIAMMVSGTVASPALTTFLGNGDILVSWMTQSQFTSSDVWSQRFTSTGASAGAAFRVHPAAAGTQQLPHVAALSGDGYVIVWEDGSGAYAGDSGFGIRGRIYGASGPVGGEFRVNASGNGNQGEPRVVALTGGGFAVVWTDAGPAADDAGYAIRAQVYTAAGAAVGGEILVNSITDGTQQRPSVSALPNGGFVVAWGDASLVNGDSSDTATMAQIFDAAGAKVGGQFLVNTTTHGYQDGPSVTALASGRIVVAWQDYTLQSNFGDLDTRLQIFAPASGGAGDIALSTGSVAENALGNYAAAVISDDGGVNSAKTYELVADSTGAFRIDGNRLVVADNKLLDHETAPSASVRIRVTDLNGASYEESIALAISDGATEARYTGGAEQTVPTSAPGDQSAAAVAQLAAGGFVMSWTDKADPGSDASGSAVKAQRFDAAGAKVGGELLVNSAATGDQARSAAAGLAGGGFVVTWQHATGDAAGSGVKAQLFDAAGGKAGGEFLVNMTTAGAQDAPNVAALAGGGFLVTWNDSQAGNLWSVRGQIFDASGTRVGGEMVLNGAGSGGKFDAVAAALPSGGFVAAWVDFGHPGGIVAQLFGADGTRIGAQFTVNTAQIQDQTDPSIAVLATGDFVVAWTDRSAEGGDRYSPAVKAQMFDAAGARIGGEFVVNTATLGGQSTPAVVALPWGGFLVSWQNSGSGGDDPFDSGVRAQIFDASGAKAGGEFLVNIGTDWDQIAPVGAVLASGAVVIGWTESGAHIGGFEREQRVEARMFTPAPTTPEGEEVIHGTAGDDLLDGRGGNDVLFGSAGNDRLSGGTGRDYMEGGAGNDVYEVDAAGERVVEKAGEGTDEVRTGLATYALPAHVEVLTATGSGGLAGLGNSLDNRFNAGSGDDSFSGGEGADLFYFAGAFTAADRADGGAGTDTLVLQGNYHALALGASSLTALEGLSLQSGSITRWGQDGTASYDYGLAIASGIVAPGQQLRINAQSLQAGEDLVFDGSAETGGGRFLIYGGFGIETLTGGAAGDIFFFEAGRFGAGDRVSGGGGNDALVISGAPAGSIGPVVVDIAAGSLSSIEALSFNGRFATDPGARPSYQATIQDGNLAGGATLIVNASSLGADQSLAFSGLAVGDGRLRIFGGEGGDSLTGGGNDDVFAGGGGGDALAGGTGADVFVYRSVSDSAGAACDVISGFHFGNDRIDLTQIDADIATGGDQAFLFIGSEAFSGKAGELRAAFDAGMNLWAIQGDVNGDGGVDFQLYVSTGAGPPPEADILL